MTFREEIIKRLADKAAKLFGVEVSSLGENTRFAEDLGCKSADIVKFTLDLEEEYDVEVPFMAFKRNKTFGEAADYMSELTGIS